MLFIATLLLFVFLVVIIFFALAFDKIELMNYQNQKNRKDHDVFIKSDTKKEPPS